MTDNVDADAAAQRASEQARLRRERREAKIKAGGSARLSKINGMGGRPAADFSAPGTEIPSPATAPKPAPAASADPEEVDISQHFYAPQTTARRTDGMPPPGPSPMAGEQGLSDAALRQMMLGFDPASAQGGPPGMMGPGAGDEDPIMKMMSQMMGSAGGGAGGASPFPGMPNFPGMNMPGQAQARPDPFVSLWRLLHALVALGLGVYIILLTPFTGTRIERDRSSLTAEYAEFEREKRIFFWVFATAETLLLTTRFLLDKGKTPSAGMLSTAVGFLPEPWKGYVNVVLRYGQIFTTVRTDILACMFVLGVCSWWRA